MHTRHTFVKTAGMAGMAITAIPGIDPLTGESPGVCIPFLHKMVEPFYPGLDQKGIGGEPETGAEELKSLVRVKD